MLKVNKHSQIITLVLDTLSTTKWEKTDFIDWLVIFLPEDYTSKLTV